MYEEYVMQHRLNFKNWRLVDVDNYMKGNPHYSDFVTADTWKQMNDNLWSEKNLGITIDGEEDFEPFKQILEDMIYANSRKEP